MNETDERPRVLLTGVNGQVGFELRRVLSTSMEVLAPDRGELDLADEKAVAQRLQQHQPQLIVNAAAYTAVDKAESEPELAHRLNAALPAQLAAYCAAAGALLVHYSSDYVYPGDGQEPFGEDSPTGPLSTYGASKLAGDQAVESAGTQHLIFRTSWVYSARRSNFMKTMLKLARSRDSLNVVADQIGAPTDARLIAHLTLLAVRHRIADGIYHLAPRGETSWHGFAAEIFRLALQRGEQLALTPDAVAAIPTSEYPTPAARPLNSRLQVDKLESALGIRLPDWQTQLELTLDEYLTDRSSHRQEAA